MTHTPLPAVIPPGGDTVLESSPLKVTCGNTAAYLHLSLMTERKMSYSATPHDTWITPNKFQEISGRQAAKDWKRFIKHHRKSLKILLKSGTMTTAPAVCRCEQCVAGGGGEPEISDDEMITAELTGNLLVAEEEIERLMRQITSQQTEIRTLNAEHDKLRNDEYARRQKDKDAGDAGVVQQVSQLFSRQSVATTSSATVIMGPSLLRGVSTEMNKRGVDTMGYVYPGANIPRLHNSVCHLGLTYQTKQESGIRKILFVTISTHTFIQ